MNEIEVLIISNSRDFTTDYVCIELNKRQCSYIRINRDLFNTYFVDFNIDTLEFRIGMEDNEYLIAPSKLKSIYYRAPIYLHYIPREILSFEEQLYRSQWMAFLRNLTVFEEVKWMNNPIATFKSENKMLQLKYARQCGMICPSTRIINCSDHINLKPKVYYAAKSLDTVILRQGKKEAFSYTNILDGNEIINSNLSYSPIVIQDNIDPKIDIRATVVGTRVFPVEIVCNGQGIYGDWRKNKGNANFVSTTLPPEINKSCIELTNRLGLSFGGVDLAFSNGKYYFIEINPTGEWAWLVNSSGHRIDHAICDYLCGEAFA